MRFIFCLFVVSIASFGVLVDTQDKDFCESFVRNGNQIDFFPVMNGFGVRIIESDYWINSFKNDSKILPNWFDTQCMTIFCVNQCDSKSGSLGCLKVIQFMFSSYVCKIDSIDFSRDVRMADMSSNGSQSLSKRRTRHTSCTDPKTTLSLTLKLILVLKRGSNQRYLLITRMTLFSSIKSRRLLSITYRSENTDSM